MCVNLTEFKTSPPLWVILSLYFYCFFKKKNTFLCFLWMIYAISIVFDLIVIFMILITE